jgi:hypothetical protein
MPKVINQLLVPYLTTSAVGGDIEHGRPAAFAEPPPVRCVLGEKKNSFTEK